MIANLLKMLIMVAAGIGILVFGYEMAVTNLSDWRLYTDSDSWLKIPAEITNLNLRKEKKGDNVEYIISCVYRYHIDDAEYHGNRIDLTSDSSIRASSSRRYHVLKLYKDVKKKIIARVNPLEPKQSLLFREITFAMVLIAIGALACLLVGCAFIAGGFYDVIISCIEKQKNIEIYGCYIISSICILLFLVGVSLLFIGISEWKDYFAYKNLFSSLNNTRLPPEFSFTENYPNLYFTIAWGLLFLFGCYLLSNTIIFKPIREKIREKRYRQSSEADRFWLRNPQWRRFRVISNKPVAEIRKSLGWSFFIGIFISLFIVAIICEGGIDPDAGSTSLTFGPFSFSVAGKYINMAYNSIFYVFILFIVLLSLGHMMSVIYQIFQYMRHGPPTLFLKQVPFVPGEKSMAWLSLCGKIPVFERIEVSVYCIGAGYYVYEDKYILTNDKKKRYNNQYVWPIRLIIPKNQPSATYANPKYTWWVKVSAVGKDIEFEEDFEIPVYNVDDPESVEKPSKPFFKGLG